MNHLAVLLPLTSRGHSNEFAYGSKIIPAIHKLSKDLVSGSSVRITVILGIDENDLLFWKVLPEIQNIMESQKISVESLVFPQSELDRLPPGPICWMWNKLAAAAVSLPCQPEAFILLGDDTIVSPAGWPSLAMAAFASNPQLTCLLLNDLADPGYPSFPIIRSSFLKRFDQLLPDIFINQGGDPFLAELARRSGGLGLLAKVTVENQIGGIQLPGNINYVPPRYERKYPSPHLVLSALEEWSERANRSQTGCESIQTTTVDVLIPSYRVDVENLERILTACSGPHDQGGPFDIRFGLVIDNPACPDHVKQSLLELLHSADQMWQGRVRLRFNSDNLGASATRNKLLEESLAEYVIFLDDDVTPTAEMTAAYLEAFLAHPQERGFAGPTLIPHLGTVVGCGMHMSDVSFFWDAPLRMHRVPWAVTANVAFKNTSERFDLGFLKTGGGEDIDFCLRASPEGLLSVPQALAHHPIWNEGRPCFLRFAKWSFSDGRLVGMYGKKHGYVACPNGPELLLMTELLLLLLLPCSPSLVFTLMLTLPPLVLLSEIFMDCLANLHPERRERHPTPSWAVYFKASVYASVLKLISECGRIAGHVSRGDWHLLCHRFDWFCGMIASMKIDEARRSFLRLAGHLAFMALVLSVLL